MKSLHRKNKELFPGAIERVERLLLSSERIDFIAPTVTREADNAVRLHWWNDDRSLSIMVSDDGACFTFCMITDEDDEEWMSSTPQESVGVIRDLLAWVMPPAVPYSA